MCTQRREGVSQSTPADYYKYSALLASVSAFEIYRRVYRDRITPARVAELLILREDMPRSLHRCMNELVLHLDAVANDQSAETLRRAGALRSTLRYGRIDLLLEEGLHEFLTTFLLRVRDIGRRIAEDFLVSTTS